MKKIRTEAFDYYFSLGPARSYQQVADHYGVTKRAVSAVNFQPEYLLRIASAYYVSDGPPPRARKSQMS